MDLFATYSIKGDEVFIGLGRELASRRVEHVLVPVSIVLLFKSEINLTVLQHTGTNPSLLLLLLLLPNVVEMYFTRTILQTHFNFV